MILTPSAIALGMLCVAFSVSGYAQQGGISLNQTRVIFSQQDKAQTVAVNNADDRSWIIQSRVLTSGEESAGPFIVTPPLFMLKERTRQILRILPQDHALPDDKESLFYLSVTAIPSQSEPAPSEDKVSLGVRFLLKLFYRPEGLTPTPEEAACRLNIASVPQGVRITNPGPYFQTLGTLMIGEQTVAVAAQQSMIAPGSSLTLPIKSAARQASWRTLNDYGGLSAPCNQIL